MARLLDTVLEAMRTRRGDFEARYGIRLLGVVGSVARGEERVDSDIDVAYRIVGPTTLLRLGAAVCELEDVFGRRVDLVNLAKVRPEALSGFERDLARA